MPSPRLQTWEWNMNLKFRHIVLLCCLFPAACAPGRVIGSPADPIARIGDHPAPAAAPAPRPAAPAQPDAEALDAIRPRIRYATVRGSLLFETSAPLVVEGGDRVARLGPGRYRIDGHDLRGARQQWHVFPKTFQPGETAGMEAYLADWRAKGRDPRPIPFGKRLRTASGRVVDNRVFWISLARFDTEADANALKKRLEAESVWAWVRPETVAPGAGLFTLRDASGGLLLETTAPLALRGEALLHFTDIDNGFWTKRPKEHAYASPVSVEVGPGGGIEVYGSLPVDHYLRGVLPAEMPASWPATALRAQAVAARSEVLASLAGKHRLEGFDFCATEHCRAYAGAGGHKDTTDAAVAATRGEVLVAGNRVVATVFSANCGGWTENNDTVWSGPPDPTLRAVADQPGAAPPRGGMSHDAARRWITARHDAHCAQDQNNYRWTRAYTEAELARHINKHHNIGRIVAIELGDRGPGGRLNHVRVRGTADTVVIRKELPIRRAFGGLPSALCILDVEQAPGGGKRYVFRGAGRGHGVGLCQHGARGMAARGLSHEAVLVHYFTGTTLERLD